MDKHLISTSKFLSLVLRHQPELIGLNLDGQGWASIETLLKTANAHGKKLDHDTLLRVVHENEKQRFAISSDGLNIRANQGHSIDVELGLQPVTPPTELYHGTVERFLESIRTQGLIKGTRQHVHLSADRRTAETVGSRRGKPIVLIVNAAAMSESGLQFYLSANGVWLTNHVPSPYLTFPQ